MAIIGSQINEINAVRKNLGTKEIRITKNLEIINIEKKKAVIFEKDEDILEISFNFIITYNKTSKIELKGTVFYEDKKHKELEKIEKEWKKNKKINTKKIISVMNHALSLSYKTAFEISERLRLPTPMQMPKFVEKDEEKSKK